MSGPLFADRVQETTTTTGTGTVTLAGAVTGYQSFAAIGNGNTCYYTIAGGAEWEVGIGTYTAAGTTLSRTTVLASSNSGALVSFSAGTKNVFVDVPAAAAPALVKVAQVVTAGSQSTIAFSSIPGTYTDLLLVITGKDTQAGTGAPNMHLQINGDTTAANYSSAQYLIGSGATAAAGTNASATTGGVVGGLPQASGFITTLSIQIPLYAGTNFDKLVVSTYGMWYGSGQQAGLETFYWASTAAITSLMLTAGGTAFAVGTTAALYGMG